MKHYAVNDFHVVLQVGVYPIHYLRSHCIPFHPTIIKPLPPAPFDLHAIDICEIHMTLQGKWAVHLLKMSVCPDSLRKDALPLWQAPEPFSGRAGMSHIIGSWRIDAVPY